MSEAKEIKPKPYGPYKLPTCSGDKCPFGRSTDEEYTMAGEVTCTHPRGTIVVILGSCVPGLIERAVASSQKIHDISEECGALMTIDNQTALEAIIEMCKEG